MPYTLTFRRAPFHRGWLRTPGAAAGKRGAGTPTWKRRYVVLAYGVLAAYDRAPGRRRAKRKWSLALEAPPGAPPPFVAGAPPAAGGGAGVVLVIGEQTARFESGDASDARHWAARLRGRKGRKARRRGDFNASAERVRAHTPRARRCPVQG